MKWRIEFVRFQFCQFLSRSDYHDSWLKDDDLFNSPLPRCVIPAFWVVLLWVLNVEGSHKGSVIEFRFARDYVFPL